MFVLDDLLLMALAASPEILGAGAAASTAALPAAGMAATGGLLGTGAGAFGASAGMGAEMLAGLGGAGGLGGSMAAAGMPASAAGFSSMLAPSTIGSAGLGSAEAYGMAAPMTLGDKMGMMATRMMPSSQSLMLNGAKAVGQGLLGSPQQPMPSGGHAQGPFAGQQQQPIAPMNAQQAARKRRDELLMKMLGRTQ